MPDPVLSIDWPDRIVPYVRNRYADLSLEQIVSALRGTTLGLLKRGSIALLIARRELGGLLVAAQQEDHILHGAGQSLPRIADLDYAKTGGR